MTHTGWRKPTPGLVVAEKHAQAGEQLSIPKTRAIVAAKKVAAAIGLKSQDLLLLDTFGAVTQTQDWEQGRRPIVWPSNNFLMEQTGFSLTTLRCHIRRLCEAGVIWMKDSSNGKRFGARDRDGYIVEAYGFDLAPLAARAEEFEALHAQLQEQRQFCKSLRNSITVTRRVIRAKIEKALENGLRGPWRDLHDEFGLLLERLPKRTTGPERLLDLVNWFKALQHRVEAAFEDAFDWPERSDAESAVPQDDTTDNNVVSICINTAPMGAKNSTHILTTNQPNPVISTRFEKKHAAGGVPEYPPEERVDSDEGVNLEGEWSTQTRKRRSDIDVPMLMATCPEFGEMARGLEGYIRDWNGVHRAAAKIRPMVGISEHAWNVAQRALGPEVAAAAIALIYDKHSAGEVSSPGGYLRGMIQKAQTGELHLDRSFYGRLSERAL
ncbi:replication protein C [Sulfitobacter sp. M57]|uniref:plasmid replication protein RepC n=1 Tax=unclassified Sulfitobacter TaxID=196795 RepID=UPI0023E2E854|nr:MULTISPECIES: plasmid replication protein RepC [unclassified Sulfitobacter]MDF3416690.1 replication protein C [Sulfitobacter sp. KE5]MDF3424171.1 replication protein C [Sulfitobacter sp. KE43]MDF3435261.1 replication protein C [Sulfitobacter sp. KE42]MDF3460875.1 replication protein C [Sulfitobacter sp. S74]MDF3464773.1 replication protein C [Sulfitobacter sp. Ks18]